MYADRMRKCKQAAVELVAKDANARLTELRCLSWGILTLVDWICVLPSFKKYVS